MTNLTYTQSSDQAMAVLEISNGLYGLEFKGEPMGRFMTEAEAIEPSVKASYDALNPYDKMAVDFILAVEDHFPTK